MVHVVVVSLSRLVELASAATQLVASVSVGLPDPNKFLQARSTQTKLPTTELRPMTWNDEIPDADRFSVRRWFRLSVRYRSVANP
jgi:hypothetical protein